MEKNIGNDAFKLPKMCQRSARKEVENGGGGGHARKNLDFYVMIVGFIVCSGVRGEAHGNSAAQGVALSTVT